MTMEEAYTAEKKQLDYRQLTLGTSSTYYQFVL